MKLIALILCIFTFSTNVLAQDLNINAAGAVLIDKNSKRILWERKATEPMAMASTTKIMTAIIALESCPLDKVITVDKQATLAPQVKMNLSTGEEITLEQLLYALMLQSSNDAAVAIAIGISGSVNAFCARMTEKAAELGCADTVFETPNGLDKGNHHSTPYDMALIAAYALDNPEFVRIIGTKSVNFSTNKNTYSITNKDRFLFEYEGALGIKTGFTGKAGHCFVGAAKRNNTTLISVVFASGWGTSGKNKKWTDTKTLMNYGFENYHYQQLVNKGAIVRTIAISKGRETTLNALISQDYGTLLKKDESYSLSCSLPTTITAPINKNQVLGVADVMVGNKCLAKIPIIAEKTVEKLCFKDYILYVVQQWCKLTA